MWTAVKTAAMKMRRGQLQPPKRQPGGQWHWGMETNGGHLWVWADTCTDLIDALHPGYADLHGRHYDQALIRIQLAVKAAAWQQAQFLTHDWDGRGLTDSEYTSATSTKDLPPRPVVEHWSAPVPLIIVDSVFLRQHGDPELEPVGNVLTIRSGGSDEEFVRSLSDCGWVRLVARTDAAKQVLDTCPTA